MPLFTSARSALLPLLALGLFLPGCKKDRQSGVPLTHVDISINLTLPEYNALTAVGGWVYLTGGSEGLLVYRKSFDEFTAMDRHCPVHPEDLCKVTVESDSPIAVDTTCCHCNFLLLDGSLASNPDNVSGAGSGLKLYSTTFNATTNELHIFN